MAEVGERKIALLGGRTTKEVNDSVPGVELGPRCSEDWISLLSRSLLSFLSLYSVAFSGRGNQELQTVVGWVESSDVWVFKKPTWGTRSEPLFLALFSGSNGFGESACGVINNVVAVVEFLLCSYSWVFFFFFFFLLCYCWKCVLACWALSWSVLAFWCLYFPMFFLVIAGFLLSLSVNVHGFFWVFCAEHWV